MLKVTSFLAVPLRGCAAQGVPICRYCLNGTSHCALCIYCRLFQRPDLHCVCQVWSGVPEGGTALEACLTADGKYIVSGCGDRNIRVWNVAGGQEVAEWSVHAGVPTCLKVRCGQGEGQGRDVLAIAGWGGYVNYCACAKGC